MGPHGYGTDRRRHRDPDLHHRRWCFPVAVGVGHRLRHPGWHSHHHVVPALAGCAAPDGQGEPLPTQRGPLILTIGMVVLTVIVIAGSLYVNSQMNARGWPGDGLFSRCWWWWGSGRCTWRWPGWATCTGGRRDSPDRLCSGRPPAHGLRHAQIRATWEPAVLTVTGCLLARCAGEPSGLVGRTSIEQPWPVIRVDQAESQVPRGPG